MNPTPVSEPSSRPPASPTLAYLGVGIIAAGFLLILLAWGQVAGKTEVSDQLPSVVAAGLGGLGAVMVGLTVVNVAAKRDDAAARGRELDQLLAAIEELRSAVELERAS